MDLRNAAATITQHISNFLMADFGKSLADATTGEFYQAFCTALREEIMLRWTSTAKAFAKMRTVYFLSMEYLPGRLLGNNIANMQKMELVQAVLAQCGRNLNELIACERDPGLGHGGLGRLSSCFLDSLATLHYPTQAYGLRYQYGIFEQEVWDGKQVEKPDCWLLHPNPWECRQDAHAVSVLFENEEVRAIPYEMPIIGYSPSAKDAVLTLNLWSTKESPRNFQLQRYNAGLFEQAAENTALTDILYPNDDTELGKRIRLKQEFLLASASLQDIIRRVLEAHGTIDAFADLVRIHINDTHPAFIIAELVRVLTEQFNFPWDKAWEACQTVCSYTNHSILPESLEKWNAARVKALLPRQYRIIERLNQQFCDRIRSTFPQDEAKVQRLSFFDSGQIRMAHLAINGSHKVNGVAKLHTHLLKTEVFPDLYAMFPDRFLNITNGVTQRRWLLHANPLLASWITDRIGSGWITDFTQLRRLTAFASEASSQQTFLDIKKKNKQALLEFLKTTNSIRDESGAKIAPSPEIGVEALFDVQIKRFHEYKRQLLNALHLLILYQELKDNPKARIPRFALFSGKASPNYILAKESLELTYAICRTIQQDKATSHLLCPIFVENYNVSKAEKIIPAADLSEQLSTAGWEASGTGNMKLAMNGALTIGTDDGANIEMKEAVGKKWWPFSFGASVAENRLPYSPKEIYLESPMIQSACEWLKNSKLASSPSEAKTFARLYTYLTEKDPYRILQDLPSYYEAQKKVEALYLNPSAWAETAIHNIAAMSSFSTDESIHAYADKVWEIKAWSDAQ